MNPYDLIRLSQVLSASTGEIIQRFTENGTSLRREPDGSCVFLGPHGCTVHGGRPAPCRVYPLGRIVNAQGEFFCELEPHAQSKGIYGEETTVDDYLSEQGAEPYFKAVDAYLGLFNEIASALPEHELENHSSVEDEGPHLFDVDAANEEFCRSRQAPLPSSAEERLACHLGAVRSWLERSAEKRPSMAEAYVPT